MPFYSFVEEKTFVFLESEEQSIFALTEMKYTALLLTSDSFTCREQIKHYKTRLHQNYKETTNNEAL